MPIGPLELGIILVIVLIIFGPKRLPNLGRSIGGGMREFKDSIGSRMGRGDDDEDEDDDGEARKLRTGEQDGATDAAASSPRREAADPGGAGDGAEGDAARR